MVRVLGCVLISAICFAGQREVRPLEIGEEAILTVHAADAHTDGQTAAAFPCSIEGNALCCGFTNGEQVRIVCICAGWTLPPIWVCGDTGWM